MSRICPQCGAPVADTVSKCEYCGASVAAPVNSQPVQQSQPTQNNYQQPQQQYNAERMNLPIKNKIVAGILAILLGGLGIHHFYLGKTGLGVIYIVFCWTYIPAILGLVEGIMILCSTDQAFETKYKCRIG